MRASASRVTPTFQTVPASNDCTSVTSAVTEWKKDGVSETAFALPIILHIKLAGTVAGVVAIAINSAAYIGEIVRGALLSISKGLREAGLAMGLPFWKVLVYIIGPLAFRRLIPPLGNQCITSLKDTSLLLVIGVAELTFKGQEIISDNFRAVEIWSAVAVIYFVMLSVVGILLQYIERRMPIL
jgi:glutamine transport system permease protein